MLKTEEKVIYKAFGLNILSEIPFPELFQQFEGSKEAIDIVIERDDLSSLWDELSFHQEKKFVFLENLIMFYIPDIAIFSIHDGKKITVSPIKGYEEEIIRLYILGTCMGALLLQRRIYPLHGSSVAIDGKAYAFIGDSGAGKSTLASTFLSQGFQLVSDDVIAVTFSKQGNNPVVTPSYPQQKLWQESLHEFGMEASRYRSIYGRETKYCIPVSTQYFVEPLPLAGVFELTKTNDEMVGIQPIEGLERLHTFYRHTYRNFLVSRLGLMEWHFNQSACLANQLNVYRIRRPIIGFSVNELVSVILATLKEGEKI